MIPINVVLLSTLIPWFISHIVDVLAHPGSSAVLTGYVLAIIGSAIIGSLLNYIGYAAYFRHLTATYAALVNRCFDDLSVRGESFYANKFTGSLTKYTIDYPNSASTLETTFIVSVLPFLVRTLSGVAVVFIGGAPWLAVLLLAITLTTLVTVYRGRRKRQGIRDVRREAQTSINAHLADVITNNQTMRTFAGADTERQQNRKLTKHWSILMNRDFSMVNKLFNKLINTSLFLQISFVIVMILLVKNGSVGLGVAIFCITYLARYAVELSGIGGMINQIENAFIDAAPMTEILNGQPEIVDVKNASLLKVKQAKVSFNRVTFAYQDNAEQSVINDLSLDIHGGEKVGLVGPSGGGKTTITKLLLRLMDIQSGSIEVDSQNIALVTQASLRKQVAYVPQEPILFHRSLADNIRYGKPDASDKAVHQAAKLAHADEFIAKLPQGYDTLVGERGVKLSGGQRQRVAIARAILKDAPILVLDEATSALDSESEKLIQDALKQLMEKRTTIVVAHRLSTIQKMDRIVVLESGVITEQGSHHELLANNGTYAKLWARQSGGFIED